MLSLGVRKNKMFLFAHIGYTLLLSEIILLSLHFSKTKKINLIAFREAFSRGWKNNYFHPLILIISSMGPDIIDKLIVFPLFGFGRHVGHSLLFFFLVSLTSFILFRKRAYIWISVIFGWFMHILLDVTGFIPWFYPFINYNFEKSSGNFWYYLVSNPTTYINEIIGFFCLLITGVIFVRRITQQSNSEINYNSSLMLKMAYGSLTTFKDFEN